MNAALKSPPAEFSRPFNASVLGEGERRIVLEATGTERSKLAERFGIPAVESLNADIVLTVRDGDRRVKAVGRLKARIVQVCVVSLEPVATTIDAAFERFFIEGAPSNDWQGEPEGEEIDLGQNRKDAPDTMTDGLFDLGEALAEQLALEIPQFPRAEKVVFEKSRSGAGPEEGWKTGKSKRENPFAVLKKLKPGGG